MPIRNYDFRGNGGGLVKDSNAFTLADNEWSDIKNVRIRNRALSKISGEATLLDIDNPPRHAIFLNGANTADEQYYYISNIGETFRVTAAGVEDEVTKGSGGDTPIPLSPSDEYQMNAFQGGYSLLVNDFESTPQYIRTVGSGTDTTELTDLPDWNYNELLTNISAQTIRPFKSVLIAGNITQTVVADNSIERNGGNIRVSNQAAPGMLPTWDVDATDADTAADFELSESGEIIDMVALADTMMVFTRNTIYGVSLTGNSSFPVRSSKQLEGRGILCKDCAVEFFGKLFVVGSEDIYIFQGGANTQSISDGRVREHFFQTLSVDNFKNTFVLHNERFDEIWVCYPLQDSVLTDGSCDRALIWNYKNDTWTSRDLPGVFKGYLGPTASSDGTFRETNVRPALPSSTGSNEIIAFDAGTTFRGTAFTASLERKGLEMGDRTAAESLQSMFFLITGSGDVEIKVRATDTPGRPVDFTDTTDNRLQTRTFNIDGEMSDLQIDPRTKSFFMNLRIEGQDEFSLHSYTALFAESDKRSR